MNHAIFYAKFFFEKNNKQIFFYRIKNILIHDKTSLKRRPQITQHMKMKQA